jgi:CCR4-NOT transcription complex subunit 7/8
MSSMQYHTKNENSVSFEKITQIKEVYKNNFDVELFKISQLIEKYPYIAIDTEFPGFITLNNNNSSIIPPDFLYANIKSNVDCLKIIQLGITLSDKDGRFPTGISTWQFNFNFNLKEDKFSQESITLLSNSGINFDFISKNGITADRFGELFITSGLILNENIHWITFHGSYDLAYFLKILTCKALPERLDDFLSDLEIYFLNFYDIRYLVKDELEEKGLSLNKLACDFGLERLGTQHQAGSDSLITSSVYFKVKENVVNEIGLINGKNKLYCLSYDNEYCDCEEISYQDVYNLNAHPFHANNIGFQTYENNFLFNGMNNYPFFNMMINDPIKNLKNCIVSSNFNSGSSTASGNSLNMGTQKPSAKKKNKKKKDKKKKAKEKLEKKEEMLEITEEKTEKTEEKVV